MGVISLPSFKAGLAQGQPDFAVIGSGLSMPPGVESVLEYNGVYLNIRDWADTFLINSIDGLHDADVRDSREVNPVADGETAFNAYYGGRTIVLGGRVRAFTLNKMRDLQMALRQAFNDLNTENPLIFHNKVDPMRTVQIYCRKSQPFAMGESQQNYKFERDFQVTLRASNPRFTTLTSKSGTIGVIPPSTPSSVVISNNGNYKAQPIITLNGPMTFPVITNETTGQVFTFTPNVSPNHAVPSGTSLTIDTATRRVYDNTGANQFSKVVVSLTEWIELAPGDNTITITATATSGPSTLVAVWRDTYM